MKRRDGVGVVVRPIDADDFARRSCEVGVFFLDGKNERVAEGWFDGSFFEGGSCVNAALE